MEDKVVWGQRKQDWKSRAAAGAAGLRQAPDLRKLPPHPCCPRLPTPGAAPHAPGGKACRAACGHGWELG